MNAENLNLSQIKADLSQELPRSYEVVKVWTGCYTQKGIKVYVVIKQLDKMPMVSCVALSILENKFGKLWDVEWKGNKCFEFGYELTEKSYYYHD